MLGAATADNAPLFMKCPMGIAACPSSNNQSCAVGYTGVLCGSCASGYYADSQVCTVCVGATKYAIVIVIVIGALAAALFVFISKRFDTTKLVNGAKVAGNALDVDVDCDGAAVPPVWPCVVTALKHSLFWLRVRVCFVFVLVESEGLSCFCVCVDLSASVSEYSRMTVPA